MAESTASTATGKTKSGGKQPDDYRMSFGEHLEELRSRIVKSLLAVIASAVVGWVYKDFLLKWLQRPLEIAWFCKGRDLSPRVMLHYMLHPAEFQAESTAHPSPDGAPALYFHGTADGFVSYLKIAIMGGLVLALPILFYQVWSFVAPGLYDREKKLVLPFVGFSTVFFLLGALFGYYLVFPVSFKWFLDFAYQIPGTNTKLVAQLTLEDYLGFTTQMLLAFGAVFELPLFIFFLALAGIVTGKQLFSFGRYFTVIAFILAAVLTPSTDVFSQVALGGPLVALYFLAAGLAVIFGPKEAKGFRKDLPSTKADDKKKPATNKS